MTDFCYVKDGRMVEVGPVDWRAFPDEPDPDDDPIETPDDVLMILGFDPNNDDEDEPVSKASDHAADAVMRDFAEERRAEGRKLGDLFREQIEAATDYDDLLARLGRLKEGKHLLGLAESLARASLAARVEAVKRGA